VKCYHIFSSEEPLFFISLVSLAGRDELELGLARLDEPIDPSEWSSEQSSELSTALERLDASLRIVRSGFLWRLSRSGDAARWTRRWFALRADATLYFFKGDNVRLRLRPESQVYGNQF
jgi:hypothetical protein